MEGFWVAACLLLIYVTAQVGIRSRSVAPSSPLELSDGLIYPALSQASSVFSLSALFGAYLGMYWLLGFPAILGIAVGSTLALFFLRMTLCTSDGTTFDASLRGIFDALDERAGIVMAGLVVLTQLTYVASELLILRQLVLSTFHVAPRHATIVVTTVAVVAYFYVLRGGYVAIFRADAVQAVFTLLLVLALIVVGCLNASPRPIGTLFTMHDLGYWRFAAFPSWTRIALHSLLGAVMGFSFLAASPDCWMRVVVVARQASPHPFLKLVAASLAPFILTLPLVLTAIPPRTGPVVLLDAFPSLRDHRLALVILLMGLVASALSAINGSMLTAIHLGVVAFFRGRGSATTIDQFHYMSAAALLVLSAVFFGLLGYGNAYFLGNLLIGPHAAAAGLLLGTRGLRYLPKVELLTLMLVVVLVAWATFVVHDAAILRASTTDQVETIPIGLLPFGVFLLLGWVARSEAARGRR